MAKETTNEDLARMMQDGFMEMDKKIDGVRTELKEEIQGIHIKLTAEIQEVNQKVDKVHDTLIHYMDYQSSRNEEFDTRIAKLETAIFEKARAH